MKKRKPRQLYFKLFWTYIAIAFFIVLSLTVYFISALVRDNLRNRQENAQRIAAEAASLAERDADAVDYLFSELYRDEQELGDVIAFLNLAPDEYQEYSLDQYAAWKRESVCRSDHTSYAAPGCNADSIEKSL